MLTITWGIEKLAQATYYKNLCADYLEDADPAWRTAYHYERFSHNAKSNYFECIYQDENGGLKTESIENYGHPARAETLSICCTAFWVILLGIGVSVKVWPKTPATSALNSK